jgi:hypothetical protein
MKAYKLFFKPDNAVPQFKRLRFEEVEMPFRDVLTRGCHPIANQRLCRARIVLERPAVARTKSSQEIIGSCFPVTVPPSISRRPV